MSSVSANSRIYCSSTFNVAAGVQHACWAAVYNNNRSRCSWFRYPRAACLRFFALRLAASLRAFVTLVRQNVSSSLRHIFSVRNSDLTSRILVAFTACSSSAQARWNASM